MLTEKLSSSTEDLFTSKVLGLWNNVLKSKESGGQVLGP